MSSTVFTGIIKWDIEMAHHDLDYCDTHAPQDIGAQIKRTAICLGFSAFFCVTSLTAQAEQKSPEEVYAGRPNNLEQLPTGWVTGSPIELVVFFNLKSAPNSPESISFLQTWYDSISSLPYDVELEVKRFVAPAEYTYAVSLTFNNWEEYREYESSEDFLAYYYAHWKSRVSEAEERVFILDTAVNLH
jgi:hypothetical protein